jgi:NNP family nitrate/nitrite transporter-like MFS transporter
MVTTNSVQSAVYNLGPVAAIPLGEGRAFRVRSLAIAVFRTRMGALFATQASCPHEAGPLADGIVGAGRVICPLHAYSFELATGSPANSGCGPLRVYAVTAGEDGEILLSLEDDQTGTRRDGAGFGQPGSFGGDLRECPVSRALFRGRGPRTTVLAAFLHFDLSFMLWVLLGALGIYIAKSLHLTASQKALVVAIPVLSGSLLRVPLGLLADRFGGKRVGVAMLCFLFLPLLIGWRGGNSLTSIEAVGILLGVAGASFAVALPLASRWYPRERQGLVLGIAAAGNSGTVMANLAAPRLADHVGWHGVMGLAMLPLALVLVAFSVLAADSPVRGGGQPALSYVKALRHTDLLWLCCFYSVTFGGYVGLSSFLPIFYRDQYGVSAITAGYLTAIAAFVGSSIRPLGGHLADRFGGVRVLSFLLLGVSAAYLLASRLPAPGLMVPVLAAGMAFLGMGNGAVFQIVPQRFHQQIGVATGTVGALGGLGGFLLPILLGNIKQSYGSFGPGFVTLALVALGAFVLLRVLVAVHRGWRVPVRAATSLKPVQAADR